MQIFSKIYFDIIDLFLKNPIGQTVGFLAFFASIINFMYFKDKKFIWGTLIASIFWGIHFNFIGALTAAYINYFDIFKNAIALKYEKNKNWMWGFLLAYFIIGIGTFLNFDILKLEIGELNYFSLLPTFASIFSTILVFKTRGVVKIG
ncbi:MAG: YgjV family protein, partial [Candidatus Gracilibacteria bacterium]|nr:YgjV family protein [Candidatus Gracilibacteria bacterium]